MKLALVAVAAACGGPPEPQSPKVTASTFAANALVDAIGKHDAAAVAGMFGPMLTYGGLLFGDPACTAQFPVAGEIPDDKRAAFATCLVALPIVASDRKDALPDVAVLEYAPGIELEVQFTFGADKAWIDFIGFSGRHDLHDALPTITAAKMDVLRVGPRTTFSDADAKTYDAMLDKIQSKDLHVWLKVCADADGKITGVHAREATMLELVEPFTAMVKAWKLTGPFTFAGKPTPACALERIAYPSKPAQEVLPLPLDDNNEVRLAPSSVEAHRIAGIKLIVPSDSDKISLQMRGSPKLVGSFKICMDESGAVTTITMLRSTGLSSYDRQIEDVIKGSWAYSPFLVNGVPTKVCTAVTFIYNQR